MAFKDAANRDRLMAPEPPASDDVQSIIRSVLRLSRQCPRRLFKARCERTSSLCRDEQLNGSVVADPELDAVGDPAARGGPLGSTTMLLPAGRCCQPGFRIF
jgi:hypothetical protein